MSDVVMARGLSLVMATRNESECIVETVRKLASVLSNMSLDTELIIADYSEDNTLELAVATGESYSLRIVPLEIGRPGEVMPCGWALKLHVLI